MDSIIEIHKLLKDKKISANELVQESLNKANKYKSLNMFNTLTAEQAIETATKIDSEGEFSHVLTGIPVSVKDVFCTKGIRTTASSKALENYIPQYDSTTVKRLKEKGAVMIGKNNSDPFAFGGSGENSGFGPTSNPLCTNKVPGGSSSGSAASVAAGINLYSIGSDTGGSIRQPAALCGVVGLKATYGRNSRYGLISMASSFDTAGVIANNVENAFIVQKSIEGFDESDGTTKNIEECKNIDIDGIKKLLNKDIKGIKIGLPKEYFLDGGDEDIKKSILDASEKLKQLGAIIKEVSLPHTKYALPVYYILVPSEISSNMGRYDGIRYGTNKGYEKELDEFYLENRDVLEPEVKRRIMIGTYTLTKGYAEKYYNTAMKVRTLIKRDFTECFNEVDLILTPSSPTVAWDIGQKNNDPLEMYLADIFTVSANCAGIPGISVPCGFKNFEAPIGTDKDGENCTKLPISMQLLGPELSEELICNVANIFEKNN
jgi:aspartyl-tRNA(Asn)/glutamyl-tRNA(Gln) amidotransferase subunit A